MVKRATFLVARLNAKRTVTTVRMNPAIAVVIIVIMMKINLMFKTK